MSLSVGEKLMRAASATEHKAFFEREATIALDQAVAAVVPRFGRPGMAANLFDLASTQTKERSR